MKFPRALYVVVALLAVAVAITVPLSWIALSQVSAQADKNAIAGRALCVLREDLQRRAQASKEYLHDNPHGAPGISVKVIRDGIANQQRTIDALSSLKC